MLASNPQYAEIYTPSQLSGAMHLHQSSFHSANPYATTGLFAGGACHSLDDSEANAYNTCDDTTATTTITLANANHIINSPNLRGALNHLTHHPKYSSYTLKVIDDTNKLLICTNKSCAGLPTNPSNPTITKILVLWCL